ncbi:hypothetical protein ACHAXT_008627 [Thalassiosira profunda]
MRPHASRAMCTGAALALALVAEAFRAGSLPACPGGYSQKRRRKYGGGKRRSSPAARSRNTLTAFENACRREGRDRSIDRDDAVSRLESMVDELLEGRNVGGDRIEEGTREDQNLSSRILPRDASSLIRLLGRNGAHGAMLKFCRRYCRDIVGGSKSSGENTDGKRNKAMAQSEAEEAVLFAYTAAIAACSKPPPSSSLASSGGGGPNHGGSETLRHRSKSFLLDLLEEMENSYTEVGSTILPNSYTLTAVLLGIDDAVEALGVLEDFETRYSDEEESQSIVTVQVYNVAIACCAKQSSENGSGWQRALSIMQTMRRNGPQPNEQTYASVLQACAEHNQMKIALSLIDEIRQSPEMNATGRLYIPLLKVCAKRGDSETASRLIAIMKEGSIDVTTETMNLLLASLAKNKLHLRALGILQEMILDGATVPDVVTFNTVLSACANADDYEAAQALLDRMRDGEFMFRTNGKIEQIRPDVISYNTVVSCAPDAESILFLLQEMRLTRRNREGVVCPNSVTFVNAISQCRKSSFTDDLTVAFETAMYLLDLARAENVDLNVFVYSATIWMAEAVGDYHTAVQLLREMKCPANTVCYDGVISALSQQGLHREALYFYYEMRQLGLSATRKTYQRLVYALDNAHDPEVAASCERKAALLDAVLARTPERERMIEIAGPLYEALIRNHGNATDPSSYQAARGVFDAIVGPKDDACLSAMLQVCHSVNPVKWQDAVMLLHSSDIVTRALGPGLVSCRALSNAVIACSKADQWEEALNLIEVYGHQMDPGVKDGKAVSLAAANAVIRACGRGSRPDKAVQLLNDMPVRYGVKPNEISYRLAIIACNQAEHRDRRHRTPAEPGPALEWWQCSLSLLRRAREDGIEPSMQMFSSTISACEAAGEWQRALGVLQSMPSFSPLLGDGSIDSEHDDKNPPEPNLYCVNAALSAMEKGGAWIEAIQLYEYVKDSVQPNFITVNSLLIALEKANQVELAETIYNDALRKNILSPWKRRRDSDGSLRQMLDLHQFSGPMAKIAVRSYMEYILTSATMKQRGLADTVIIVGKGKGSEEAPVLMPTILSLLREEFGVDAAIDSHNSGRIRVPSDSVMKYIERKRWKGK